MKVTVFGAGAVGGHLAVRLGDRTGHELSVVAIGAHLTAIQQGGLTLTWRDGHVQTVRPHATGDAATLPVQDVVIVTLKAPALASAALDIARLIGPDTITGFVLNGIPWWYDPALARLDVGGALHRFFPPDRRVGMIAYSANEVVAPGRIATHSSGRDAFLVGATGAGSRGAAAAMTDLLDEIRPAIWRKLMLNAAFSGVATAAELRVGEACADPLLAARIHALADEIRVIAAAHGIAIGPISESEWQAISRSTHRPSLLQDLLLGRPMELDALFGAPLDIADRYGIDAPALRSVTAEIAARFDTLTHVA
jgi:2-dehydropantoate 2-reductase